MTSLVSLIDVQRREIVWLEQGTIPRGMISIVAGHPGLGKSMWALGLAAKRVFVPHPIQDRTDDEMRALADAAVEDILAALRGS